MRRLLTLSVFALSLTLHQHTQKKNRYKKCNDNVNTKKARRKRWAHKSHTESVLQSTVRRILTQIENAFQDNSLKIVISVGNVSFNPTWSGHDGGSFVFRVLSLLKERTKDNDNIYILSMNESLTTKTCLCQFVDNDDIYGRIRKWASRKSRSQFPSLRELDMFEPLGENGKRNRNTLVCSLCNRSFSRDEKSAIAIALCFFCLVYRGYRPLCLERLYHHQIQEPSDEVKNAYNEKEKKRKTRRIEDGHSIEFKTGTDSGTTVRLYIDNDSKWCDTQRIEVTLRRKESGVSVKQMSHVFMPSTSRTTRSSRNIDFKFKLSENTQDDVTRQRRQPPYVFEMGNRIKLPLSESESSKIKSFFRHHTTKLKAPFSFEDTTGHDV